MNAILFVTFTLHVFATPFCPFTVQHLRFTFLHLENVWSPIVFMKHFQYEAPSDNTPADVPFTDMYKSSFPAAPPPAAPPASARIPQLQANDAEVV